jgi:hypothetical protein
MKVKLYFQPLPVVLALLIVAAAFWLLALEFPAGRWLAVFALFYSVLFVLSAWSLLRIVAVERWRAWTAPGRVLILAPHEDDCTIAAGGIGLLNRRLGGATRIVYLAPDETPGLPEIRAAEAQAAWALAGVAAADLRHVPLLPKLRQHDPQRLRDAAISLRAIIDDFQPTLVIVPMFEGGHVQHDMLAALIGSIVTPQDRFEVCEAPEYTPYVSLRHTPHRIIALCARWLFGLVSYYGPPDGIDGRTVEKIRLEPADLELKRRMLGCFVSQNAPSLVATRGYPDRLVRMKFDREWAQPFDYAHSYLRLAFAARRWLPGPLARGLLPGATGTIGRDDGVTDWRRELPPDA